MSQTGITWADVLKPEIMGVAIPILAILVGGALAALGIITKSLLSHRERMAMIERGMHPDDVTGQELVDGELPENSAGEERSIR